MQEYANQVANENEETVTPKETKCSHLHPSFQTVESIRALTRYIYENRQTLQWDLEAPWWQSQEGKLWFQSHNIQVVCNRTQAL